ncbi:hypothetical protein [Actinoplanes sp. NPDC049681]|uniref:hypothetical protein n=1 Tax=Actinoplanes sp. NPDC049681 TaxID=3363905 RepID=UPI00378C032B
MTNPVGSIPPRRERRRSLAAKRLAALAVLPVVAVPFAASQPAQAATSSPPVYSLAATVSPPALIEADCTGSCVVAPAPSGADDHRTLQDLVNSTANLATPAVLDASGAVVTPAVPATVLLKQGTYRLSQPLVLPLNVNLRGAGIALTTVRMISANAANFNYGFLITWKYDKIEHPGTSNLVSDLTVNGNCREGAGDPVPADLPGRPGALCDFRASDTAGALNNAGGGIAVGNHWTVRQVRFTNLEYFKVWVGDGVKDVHITDNRFDNWGGAESGGEDNVGGGSRNDSVVVEYNQFDKTIHGNSFDFTNAIRTTIRNNSVRSDGTVTDARPDKAPSGNMYLEGLVQATVADNTLWGAQISVKTNAGYDHSGENKDITNPRDTVISGNHISYPTGVGISLVYDDYKDSDGTLGTADDNWDHSSTSSSDHIVRTGGNNVIRDNVVEYANRSGILVNGSYEAAKSLPDTITGNTVTNSGWGGSTVYDSGAGLFDTAGIGLSIGTGDRISGNAICDDPAKKTTWYGIDLGARRAPTSPKSTIVDANSTANLIGKAVHDQKLTPEPPASLVANKKTLTWDEAYALDGRPITGYKIYRDGNVVGDLSIGSVSIPGNLVPVDDSNFENAAAGTSGWTAGYRTTLSRQVGNGSRGAASMLVSSSGTGEVSFTGRAVPATPGQIYTSVLSAKAMVGSGHWVRAGLKITTASGQVLNLAMNNRATVDYKNGWMTSNYSYQAPADAVSVQPWYIIEGTVAGDAILVDRLGLVAGTRTEQFTETAPPSGPAVYHVVAYTAQDNSTPATVATS